ncbi:reverse transcriptase domain-containing protein [Tanacetum coccineum]
MAVMIAWQWWGGGMETAGWRVVARDMGDGVDRVTRNLFGFGRKSRPEKFPGGGGGAEAAVVQIRQKSQENRQKRANTDTRTEECARAGSQRLLKIKGQKGQSKGSNTCWQSYTSSNSPYWSITSKNDTLAGVEAQRMMGFVLKALTEVAQMSQSRIAMLCMRTRSQARNRNRRQQQLTTVIVEEPEFPMADNRTMAQMLQAPIEGYEDAIVVPPINANNFELKQTLINLVQSNQFTGKQDPHNHLRFFNKVTSTFRHPEVPNTSIKLLLFPFSLEGEARTWLDKEPPRSILTWDDLVSKFINQFFPPSKTTYLRNEITTFLQKPNETFNEAWERFKGLLRQCPHHGFSELHQLDTFYNSLNTNDQDALDSAAGGNFLDKMPRDGLAIIESKSKVRYSRSRAIEPRASTNAPLSTSTPSNSFEFQQLAASLEDKMDIRMSRLEKMISEKNVTTPATVKAVEEVCVTCGANHNFNNCPLTRNEFPIFHDNIHQFQQTAAVGNFVQRNPPNLASQMRPPGFNLQNNQGNQSRYQGNNFNSNQNRGNNFNQNHQNNQGQVFQPPTNQPPVYQVPPYQAPTPQIQGVSKMDFENYVKANDAVLKNVQNQVRTDELFFDSLPPGNDDSTLKKDLHEENFQVYSNPLFEFDDNFKSSTINPLFDEMEEDVEIKNSNVSDEPVLLNTPLSDKVECFAPEDNNDEIDAFLAMEISSNFEEGYFDSEGDVTFLDNLLSDDASHNLASEVISDHEPEQNESSITFSPRSDPLHHEFAGELLTLPSGNDREFEEYLSLMTVLCEISTSQSSVIESLPVSPIPVEDSEPAQEEIDIFLVPDDLIPPGVENDDSEDEDNELPNLDHQDDLSIPRPPPEPPDVEKCFEPEAGTDISKITMKNRQKRANTEHENTDEYKRAKDQSQSQKEVNFSQL